MDSIDRYRIQEARTLFNETMAEKELQDAVVLLIANKQDLPNCMSPEEVAEEFNIESFQQKGFRVACFGSSVTKTGITIHV